MQVLSFYFYGNRFSFDVEVKVKDKSKKLRLTFDLAILPSEALSKPIKITVLWTLMSKQIKRHQSVLV